MPSSSTHLRTAHTRTELSAQSAYSGASGRWHRQAGGTEVRQRTRSTSPATQCWGRTPASACQPFHTPSLKQRHVANNTTYKY